MHQSRIKFRLGPPEIRPLKSEMRCAGCVVPLQYDGAPERFFQALDRGFEPTFLLSTTEAVSMRVAWAM